jgi:hypothetical protein
MRRIHLSDLMLMAGVLLRLCGEKTSAHLTGAAGPLQSPADGGCMSAPASTAGRSLRKNENKARIRAKKAYGGCAGAACVAVNRYIV